MTYEDSHRLSKLPTRLPTSRLNAFGILERLDINLDNWQKNMIMSVWDKKTVYWSLMRQIGKTYGAISLASLEGLTGRRVLFSTHTKTLAGEVFKDAKSMLKKARQIGLIDRIDNASYEIHFVSGGSIYFKVRGHDSAGAGVGLSFDTVIFDEATKLTKQIMVDILPTTNASKDRRFLFISTPPNEDDWKRYPDSPFIRARYDNDANFYEFSSQNTYDPFLAKTMTKPSARL